MTGPSPATALRVVGLAALSLVAGLLLWSTEPVLLGWHVSAVVSGSMAPGVRVGDVVVAAPLRDAVLAPGQVIVFADPEGTPRTLVHRIVAATADGRFVTKGDANQSADSTPVARSDVRGVARLRVPFAGLPRLWWQQRDWPPLVAVAVLTTLATAAVLPGARDDTGPGPAPAGPAGPV